jgi:SAM-dependent methyltransferase
MTESRISVIEDELRLKGRHLLSALENSRRRFGKEWERDCNLVFGIVFPDDEKLRNATQGYIAFSNQGMRAQVEFQRRGRYQFSSFDEVASNVYFDENYMTSCYLPGLLLSHLLWPHHYAQLSFYRRIVEKLLPATFAEIGVGTGVYSLFTLLQFPTIKGLGVDISKSSLSFATGLLQSAGLTNSYETQLCDITKSTLPVPPDLVVSVELLEHLEDPVDFLRGIKNLIKNGGDAFVTAAINAAHADHIYLYSSVTDIEVQFKESGLRIVEYIYEPAYNSRKENELVPAIAAFHLRSA